MPLTKNLFAYTEPTRHDKPLVDFISVNKAEGGDDDGSVTVTVRGGGGQGFIKLTREQWASLRQAE